MSRLSSIAALKTLERDLSINCKACKANLGKFPTLFVHTGPVFEGLSGWQLNLESQLKSALPYKMADHGIEGRSDRVREVLNLEELASHELEALKEHYGMMYEAMM